MSKNTKDCSDKEVIEIECSEKQTALKNNMNAEQHKRMIKKARKGYPRRKARINRLVNSLRKKISKCDPISLLLFASGKFLTSNLGISSEFQLSEEAIVVSRMTEYIQSVLVSTSLKYKGTNKDPSRRFLRIQKDIEKLYKLIYTFYLYWVLCIDDLYPNYDDDIRKVIFEAQALYVVRGHRYQIFEKEYLQKLLDPHDKIFNSLFGISSDEIVDGFRQLQYAISQGKVDECNKFGEIMNEFFENAETDIEKLNVEYQKVGEEFVENFLGTKLNNVIEVTGWPRSFVASLSFKINEYSEFFNQNEYAGWPIIDLPIHKRPFININNDYYCFDYYSFVDHFYRAIQKAVSRKEPDYKWSDTQKEASENMVSDVFAQILPGSTIHRDSYYPKNNSIKNLSENDIIIQYENILLIVEVKAGSFVYTAPIVDFENHIRSYKSLIEKADHQCQNTYDYLTTNSIARLYKQDGTEKAKIDMSKINDIFMISVTIDNINSFAAKAEKLSFLKLKCNAISLSIDDLMVYREYFDSPLVFLHFLKQRRQATQEAKLALNDELDHLGMYIEHNMYCRQLSNFPDNAEIIFEGYREELDKYFCALYHPQLNPVKPTLNIPEFFNKIINWLETNNIPNKVQIANYFLDFSTGAKMDFGEYVQYTLKRQQEIGRMLAFGVAGKEEDSLRYTVFVEQPNIIRINKKEKRDYVLSTLLWNGEKDRVLIELAFNTCGELIKLKYKCYTNNDIPEDMVTELMQQAENRAIERVRLYLKQQGEPGLNDYCPCGSGEAYGQCCNNRRFLGGS